MMKERYSLIQRFPLVPVDNDIRCRFTVRNLTVVLILLVADYFRGISEVATFLDLVVKLLEGG